MELSPLSWRDRLAALALAVAHLALLLSTSDAGYTRDESFYFNYGQVYARWFHDLETSDDAKAREEVLGRKAVERTWSQNFEHPPLMKILFGYSWRWFGEKAREARWSARDKAVALNRLQAMEGFEEGAAVRLYGPTELDEAGRPRPPEELGLARVAERGPRRALLELVGWDEARVQSFRDACEGAPRGEVQRGCTGVEARAFAWLSEIDAFRLPAMATAALLTALIYLFGAATLTRWAGLYAAVTFALVPRHFFHAHLVCFDAPITLMVFATLYAFARSERSTRWAWITAIVWGVALLTKHNAFFIPVALLMYWAVASWRQFHRSRAGGPGVGLPPFPLAFLLMPPVGLFMLFAFWPRLWYDPFRSFARYLGFHLNHEHYLQYYFGEVLAQPPFPIDYPFTLTLLTVPVVLLLAFGYGLAHFASTRKLNRPLKVFYLVNLLIPILVIAMPKTPIFGGIKHWMTAMPFFALIGGWGVDRFVRALEASFGAWRWPAPAAAALIGGLTMGSLWVQNADVHPHGTAYWNELIGGVQGAANAGMQRQFWGYAARDALPYLNATVKPSGRVYFQNTTCGSHQMYQREGLLRADVGCSGDSARTAASTFHHQKSFSELETAIRERYDRLTPDHVVSLHGVPLLSVYGPRAAAKK